MKRTQKAKNPESTKTNTAKAVDDLKTKAKEPRVVGVDDNYEIPNYLIVNKYLTKGYRVGFQNSSQIFRSLFYFHNDFFSIWSHILGSIFFLYLAYWIVFHFNDARTIFDDFVKKFYTFDLAKIVREVVKNEITPTILSLRYQKLLYNHD